MRWSGSKSIIGHRNWVAGGAGAAALAVAMLVPAGAASAAPRQLYGKSVTVSWTETRSQRRAGEGGPFRPVSVNLQRSVYISTAGRLFARTSSTANVGRRSLSGSAESVGTSGANFSGGARNVQFQGNSIVMLAGFTAGARRVVINFDSSFQSCNAQVITAKQVGAKTASWRGIAGGGVLLEVESVSAGPASCSIQSGNVFAD
jgi:hypothetical protein